MINKIGETYVIDGVSFTEEGLVAKYGETIGGAIVKTAKSQKDAVTFTASTEYNRPARKYEHDMNQMLAIVTHLKTVIAGNIKGSKLNAQEMEATLAKLDKDTTPTARISWSNLTPEQQKPFLDDAKIKVDAGRGQKV